MPDNPLLESLFSLGSSLSSVPSDFDAFMTETEAKRKLSSYKPRSQDDDTAKVLRSFVDHLPRDGKQNIVTFIANCDNDETLFALSEHLYSAILVPMKAYRCTPAVTPSPLDDADIRVDEVASMLLEPSSRNDQARLKKLCLQRDGYRCMLAGLYDEQAHGIIPESILADRRMDTELVHILSFSLGKYSNNADVDNALLILMKCF
ncbi:hypothetical protein VTN77DRAFT_8381 [Rasamsonia byssochlamydoides]|uniref:uncharacterized protein n=1 Tax=Rasamsonia byssochlamydoides TaxID=89139 RepID=UPI003743B394